MEVRGKKGGDKERWKKKGIEGREKEKVKIVIRVKEKVREKRRRRVIWK